METPAQLIIRRFTAAPLFLVCFYFGSVLALSQTVTVPPKDRIVVIISLDGFPAYDLEDPKLPVPTLRQLSNWGETRLNAIRFRKGSKR